MIVRDRPSGIRLFFVVRGSILKRIRLTLLVNTLSAILVTLLHGNFFALKITLTTIPFTLDRPAAGDFSRLSQFDGL